MDEIVEYQETTLARDYLGEWTSFWDMHSGGGTKYKSYNKIYVQGSEDLAIPLFQSITGQDPNDIACECCGQNYSISTGKDFVQCSAYHRNCIYDNKLDMYIEETDGYRKVIPVEDYILQSDVLLIFADGSKNK